MSGTNRRRTTLAAVVAATAALALSACSSSASGGAGQTGFITGAGGLDTAAAGHRQPAPEISGTTIDGGKASLADYKGKVVVLNVWGSWCGPCRAEAAGLETVAQKFKDQGVQFLGINTRDNDPANATAFEKNFGVTYPSIFDPDGTQILKFPKGSLNPQAIPSTIVVDRDGNLAARSLRAISADDLTALIAPIVAEKQQ
jgi:thiol-disulfide isomerase/thioredoxin